MSYQTEKEAAFGLDICGYLGKWNVAKFRATPNDNYWENVRRYFLELGGCYLSEKCPCKGDPLKPLTARNFEFPHPPLFPTKPRQG